MGTAVNGASISTGQAGAQQQELELQGREPPMPEGQQKLTEQCLQDVQAYVEARVRQCCKAVPACIPGGPDGGARNDGKGASGQGKLKMGASGISSERVRVESREVPGLAPLPAGTSDADLELLWSALEHSMKTVSWHQLASAGISWHQLALFHFASW